MALSVLAYAFIADPVSSGPTTTSPIAGIPYTLDVAWGPAPGDAAAVFSTALSCAGGAIDTTYSAPYTLGGHRTGLAGYNQIDQGWSPDNVPVWLSAARFECAAAFWRITFPSTGDYAVSLANVGTVAVTVASAAPAPTYAGWTVTNAVPMGRQPAKVGVISWSGDYPSGGLDLPAAVIGCDGVFFADINPQPPLQFSWTADKLHVFDQNGEVETGDSVSFVTNALFIGGAA